MEAEVWYTSDDGTKWRLTTFSKANLEAGWWKEIPEWYRPS
jgi:hypothetical protein